MRKAFIWLGLAAALTALHDPAYANLFGMTKGLGKAVEQITYSTPTLPPMAFTRFCLQYADECRPRRMVFRGGRIKITGERWAELNRVNRDVNLAIEPEANVRGLAYEEWLIRPARGDCNDYAVTKRHELITRGWSARNLLLSEVVTMSGEHHLVLVVRTSKGDLVLDSLTSRISRWNTVPYRWVRIQTAKNPNFWAVVNA
jgi:predicted transglutaminase-like cysteine proteinase